MINPIEFLQVISLPPADLIKDLLGGGGLTIFSD